MPDLRTFTIAAGVVLTIVVLVWFAVGTIYNIRRGERVLTWLQDALPKLGERTTLRWLGSNTVELKIERARAPFRRAEAVIVLEPRDVGPYWAWTRSRGRRDFLILRGELKRRPRFGLEARDVRGWTGRGGLRRVAASGWSHETWGEPEVEVGYPPGAAPAPTRRRWEELAAASGGIWRLSVRNEPPHLEVHVLLPDVDETDPGRLVEAFVGLAGTVR
jgi:hypothetical protein